jgi:hypothetical protein
MFGLILASYFAVIGDISGGTYSEDILGPFVSRKQCEQVLKDLNAGANLPHSPIRIRSEGCSHYKTINRMNQSWSLLGPLIARRQAMGKVTHDVWNRPNAPAPIELPRYGVVGPNNYQNSKKNTPIIRCSETGCQVIVNGKIVDETGTY